MMAGHVAKGGAESVDPHPDRFRSGSQSWKAVNAIMARRAEHLQRPSSARYPIARQWQPEQDPRSACCLCPLILECEGHCSGKGQSSQPMPLLARHRPACALRDSAGQIMRWSNAM
jgi:hypothetical protein